MIGDLFGSALEEVLRGSPLNPPDELPKLIARGAQRLGAIETSMYLVDYEQTTLSPLPWGASTDNVSVEGSLAGRAFRLVELQEFADGDVRRLWSPLLDGVERLGVVEFVVATDGAPLTDEQRQAFSRLAHLAAELLVTNSLYTDSYEWFRRRSPMNLPAEMQHSLLPPLTFGAERIVISGLLAPAYEVGGDAFDYALNGNIAHVAVFDAVGHGLQASLLANLAVACYRNSRRAGLDLADTAFEMDTILDQMFGAERYVTAVLTQLDVDSGTLRWLNAGHPQPMLLRDGRVVKELQGRPVLPLGLNALMDNQPEHFGPEAVHEESLEPGDRLLLLTDGVDEARTADGAFFGRARLAEFAAREAASGLPTPEVMRRLQRAILAHQTGALQDDATTLFVEWVPLEPGRLTP